MGSLPLRRLTRDIPLTMAPVVLLATFLAAAGIARAQVFVVGEKTAEADVITDFHPTHVELPTKPLSEGGYMDLIRNLESEQGFAHRELPLGAGLTLVANGNLTPRGEEYKQILYKKGESAAPGERVAITSLKVERDRIILDVNGGPYAKHRILSHISINDMQLAQQGALASGSRITLVFEGGIPEVTAAEVKALLDPIIDFRARSAAEAYANSMSPVVRDAIESHKILVGMDQRMVLASLGAPQTKHREHTNSDDANSPVLEEWIYGEPPTPIQFVRFRGGRVVRLEIAAIGRPIEIHDKSELGGDLNEPVLQARTIFNGDEQRVRGGDLGARRPPTLARPGEVLDASVTTMGKVQIPGSGSDAKDCKPAGNSSPSSTSSATATPKPPSTSPQPTASSGANPMPAPCPAVAKQDEPRKRTTQPTIASGTPPIGMPEDVGDPSSNSPAGIGTPGSQSGPGGTPGRPISGLPGSGLPGSGSPSGSYPGSTPTFPGSGIPPGPNHVAPAMLP